MKRFAYVLSLGVLIGAAVVIQLRSNGEAVPLRKSFDTFPAMIAGSEGREATRLDVEVLNILKVNDYLMRRYIDAAGRTTWLYIGYWQTQRKGAQMHSPRNCLPGSGWEPLEASLVSIPVGARTIVVNRFIVQKEAQREVVLYWYQAQGTVVARELDAKLAMVKSAMTRNRTDGALVRVSSPVYTTVAEVSDRLVAYIQAMYPLLVDYLPV